MTNAWMIRSGGGSHLELFESGLVGIGFGMEFSLEGMDLDELRSAYQGAHPGASIYKVGGAVGMLDRIANIIAVGDGVVTYDPGSRVYWIGKIASDYYFDAQATVLPHRRKVDWEKRVVSRDALKKETRNSLGSVMTIFQISPDTWEDLQAGDDERTNFAVPDEDEIKSEIAEEKVNVIENARERLKDRIVTLEPNEMEELLAALLRAMGFRATVSPVGPDRGVDVIASPDGLGLQEPRIKGEVKHRKTTQMGAPEIRSFIGGLRPGDRGLYLSTGGFTREARYEAERANVPVTLIDLDSLARLIETNYGTFDNEGRALLPLTRIYWPAD